jgi:ActR/RegA family two-component response regulator
VSLLLLDDEEVFSKILGIFCKEKGLKFYYAKNIEEAKVIAQNNKVKYAIIDQYLKNEKGSDFGRYLKNKFPEIKTIICSGSNNDISDEELKYFDISVNKSELVTFINEVLIKS